MANLRFTCDCGSILSVRDKEETGWGGTKRCNECGRVFVFAVTINLIDRSEPNDRVSE